MEGLELSIFQIISTVGLARSYYIEAIENAKNGDFETAELKIASGQEMFNEGHKEHAKLIKSAASGEKMDFEMLIMHAEDQLMSAEAFGILAEQFVNVYKRLNILERS